MKEMGNKHLKGLGINWLINALALLVISYIPYRGAHLIQIGGLWTAIFVPLVLGVINSLIKPLAFMLAVPQKVGNIFLITLVVNIVLLMFFSYLNILGTSFRIPSFFGIVLVSILFSAVSVAVSYVTGKDK